MTAAERAIGSLTGLAVGDAIGTTLEFTRRDAQPEITDMVGGGPFNLKPGEWTDDTSMALCLADSLLAHPDLNEADLMTRFWAWYRDGENSVTGRCFDIGMTTRSALQRFHESGAPLAGDTDPHSAGNGSLMRLAPVAIRHHADREKAMSIARRQSRTTHGAEEAVDACAFFCELLVEAISGAPRDQVLTPRSFSGSGAVAEIAGGSFIGLRRDDIRSTGYVVDTLNAALWCVHESDGFDEAVLRAANLGDDADTVAAVTGQLAGALWGDTAIRPWWRQTLAWYDDICRRATTLFEAGHPRATR